MFPWPCATPVHERHAARKLNFAIIYGIKQGGALRLACHLLGHPGRRQSQFPGADSPRFWTQVRVQKRSDARFRRKLSFQVKRNSEVLHVQLATPLVKCEPARKLNVALMFNHKRSHPTTLAACCIMSTMMLLC